MERPGKYGLPANLVAGWLLAVLGGGFCSGVVLDMLVHGFVIWMFFHTIMGMGALAAGIVLLIRAAKERRIARELMEGGRYVWGEIVSVERNALIRFNGSYPWFARVRYCDGTGNVLVFESRGYIALKLPDLIGRKVRVYVDSDYRRSHVDLEST